MIIDSESDAFLSFILSIGNAPIVSEAMTAEESSLYGVLPIDIISYANRAKTFISTHLTLFQPLIFTHDVYSDYECSSRFSGSKE